MTEEKWRAVSENEAFIALRAATDYNPGTGRNIEDVAKILAAITNCPKKVEWYDGDYVWIVEMTDGVKGMFTGWHDSSGWDCQSTCYLVTGDLAAALMDRAWKDASAVQEALQEQGVDLSYEA